MAEKTSIEEIKKLWGQSADTDVLKAATENIEGYPPEIRSIIIEEAAKRQLIEINSSGEQFLSDRGQSIAHEIKESKPSTILRKIGKTIGVIIVMTVIAGLLGINISKTSAVTAIGAAWILKIWEVTPFKKTRTSTSEKDIVLNKRYK
jgi:hypothetical protein